MAESREPDETEDIDYDALLADEDETPPAPARARRAPRAPRRQRAPREAPPIRKPPVRSPLVQSDEWKSHELVWLVAITLLAGFLRLYRIGEWSFWIDEVHTLRDGVVVSLDEFWSSVHSKRPLQYLLIRWLEPLLPDASEGSYRLVFAFFGILSVPLMAIVVRRMFGAGPALLSAAILTLSPWHVYWSQTVRGYSVVLFLGLLALYLFWLGVELGRGVTLLLSLVVAGLATLTHPSSVTFLLAFLVFLALLRLRVRHWPAPFDWRGLTRLRLGAGPWPTPLRLGALLWFLVPLLLGLLWNLDSLWTAFESYMRSKGDILTLPHLANTTVFFVRIPVMVAAIGGVFFLWHQRSRTGLLLVLYVAVPLLALSIASFFVRVSAQYAFFALPVWCILAGYGGWEIVRRLELRAYGHYFVRLLPIAMILVELAGQLHLYYHYRHGERPRWREAAEYVLAHLGAEDIVASTNVPCMEWYLNPNDPEVVASHDSPGARHVQGITSWQLGRGDLEQFVKQADARAARVWIVTTQPLFQEMDPQKIWDTWVRARFHQVRRLPNWVGPKDMTVLVYRYDPPRPAPAELGQSTR